MQLFTNTPVFLANQARSSLDPVNPTPNAEQGLPAPVELDADTLRHIGGGVTELSTPVVSW
jgi:hypothetical protein